MMYIIQSYNCFKVNNPYYAYISVLPVLGMINKNLSSLIFVTINACQPFQKHDESFSSLFFYVFQDFSDNLFSLTGCELTPGG